MLAIQEYLRGGKTIEDLKSELFINYYEHPTLPLVGFKYDMLESPRANPIVIEARGIVLEKGTWDLVAKPFSRFYNLGEQPELFAGFDWSNFRVDEKCDGSLMILYHYKNEWHVNTSGSFGLGECNFSGKNWRDLFWETSGLTPDSLKAFRHLTLIFEMWTPFNKVVRSYPKSQVWLLGAFEPAPIMGDPQCRELRARTVDHIAEELSLQRPISYNFSSIEEITKFLKEREITDKTFEGVVIRDHNNIRAKVKSATYVAIHGCLDNGNIFNPARQVPLILTGETHELYAVMKDLLDSTPELKARLEQTKAEVEAEWLKLKKVWEETHKIENQKEFALKLMKGDDGKPLTPFTGILFSVRKTKGAFQTLEDVKALWRDSADLITKRLYG